MSTREDLIPKEADKDADLLERAARGEADAFEAFVDKHEAAIMRFIRTTTDDPAASEDALQNTFVSAWRSAQTYRGGANARGWLLAIARNHVRKAHRKRVGEPDEHVPLDEIGAAAGWGTEATGLVDRVSDTDVVETGLMALSAEDREVLVLRDLEGHSNEEAAELLGLSVAATKSRIHRARLRFVARVRKEVEHAG